MARLFFTSISSLDGYVADEEGRFGWCAPDREVHAFVNDLERTVGTYLYGRRMYEVMRVWEDDELLADGEPVMRDFAGLWREAEKVVYSSSLEAPSTARTRIERSFDPDAVRALKVSSGRDLSIGGPGLAAHAFRAGLVDECHLLLAPVVVGGGTRGLPDGVRFSLELLAERRFGNGFVHLHYRVGR
jgi:dihydrofolate reductase